MEILRVTVSLIFYFNLIIDLLRYIQYDHIFSEMSTTNFEIAATSRYDNFICFSVY